MKKIQLVLLSTAIGIIWIVFQKNYSSKASVQENSPTIASVKRSLEEKQQASLDRLQYEYDLLKDPNTGKVSQEQQDRQREAALSIQAKNGNRKSSSTYTSRGPSNLGGRTRALVIDISDETSNTMLSGGVSSGVYRTTNGGDSWDRVSANNDIHNVTCIAQDPRPGFQNTWYYGTGELAGNSASIGALFLGQGVWQSNDSGLTWDVIPETSFLFEQFDSDLDIINEIEVNPTTGDLFIATANTIYKYDGTDLIEVLNPDSAENLHYSDLTIDPSGRIYASIGGSQPNTNGVYLSEDNGETFSRIAQNGSPAGWSSAGRTVIATVPSNDNYIYVIYRNGLSSADDDIEADLWRYNRATGIWEDFSSTLPDLTSTPVPGIDPFSIQGGYDLEVSVSPSDENYVVIGGTSAYRIRDIENDPEFRLIGGYNGPQAVIYNTLAGDDHHPDIHTLVFDPFNENVLFSGSDGGIHRTDDIDSAARVDWVNLNNNYQTYQYFNVFLDQREGSDIVIGGAQDNGTTYGGIDVGEENNTEMSNLFGGDGVSVGLARPNGEDLVAYFGLQNGFIFRSNLPETEEPELIRPLFAFQSGLFVTLFHLDPDNTENIYFANNNNVFRTTSASVVSTTTWADMGPLPIVQRIRSFATTRGEYDPTSSFMLVGGQSGGVFRLDDPENNPSLANAVNITPEGAAISDFSVVIALAIHPTNHDIAMAAYSNFGIPSIFITSNATSDNPTWTLVERNLAPFSIRAAQIIENDGPQYFVGTARGLYSSSDPLTSDWEPEGVEEMGIPLVNDLEYRPSDRTMLVGTHGNGMYQTQFSPVLSTEDVDSKLTDNNLSTYPNPAIDQLNFRLNGQGATFNSFEIIDYTGRMIDRASFDSTAERSIDVSNLSTGIYFLRVTTQNNQTVVRRFVKK